jgi:hypothetical protein
MRRPRQKQAQATEERLENQRSFLLAGDSIALLDRSTARAVRSAISGRSPAGTGVRSEQQIGMGMRVNEAEPVHRHRSSTASDDKLGSAASVLDFENACATSGFHKRRKVH